MLDHRLPPRDDRRGAAGERRDDGRHRADRGPLPRRLPRHQGPPEPGHAAGRDQPRPVRAAAGQPAQPDDAERAGRGGLDEPDPGAARRAAGDRRPARRDRARRAARRDRPRGRHARVRPGPAGPRLGEPADPDRLACRVRRPVGSRQDEPAEPAAALLRPDVRARARRRPRHARRQRRVAAAPVRRDPPGHASSSTRRCGRTSRSAGPDATDEQDRRRRRGGPAARVHRRAPGGLRDRRSATAACA